MADGFVRSIVVERFLNSLLVSVLLRQVWFRWVMVVFLLAGLVLAISVPKVWVSSPPGIHPPVRVSLIDLAQAWSLRRTADRATDAGHGAEAASAWQGAISHNPGDLSLLRGALNHLVQSDVAVTGAVNRILFHTAWLLRLSEGDRADVGLAAQVYDRFELSAGVVALLEPRAESLTAAEERVFLMALFREGRMDEFGRRWARLAEAAQADRELELYHAAYLAGWGPPGGSQAGRARLEEAQKDPDLKVLACRLKLAVSAQYLDVEGYQAGLQRLDRAKADRLTDRICYWLLLQSVGRLDRAQREAAAYRRTPVTPTELLRLAEAYVKLGLKGQALELLKVHAVEFGVPGTLSGADLWKFYTDLLVEMRQWADLRAAAYQLRVLDQASQLLTGFSFFMEARAEYGLNHFEQARLVVAQIAEHSFEDAHLALQIASNLVLMGYAAAAEQILARERRLTEDVRYWKTLAEAYDALRDPLQFFRAAGRAHGLAPDDPLMAQLYARALVMGRLLPEQAVLLTQRYLDLDRAAAQPRVHHALALAMNRRFTEAEETLRPVQPEELVGRDQTLYYLAAFEISVGRQRPQLAREALDRIRPEHLSPNQLKWLDQQVTRLAPI
ncbi:MAG: hypothetical protein FJ387_05830 [Verrucomicrobia bacterium]|nr:hypothetical protein [Verrucomicrobiota bacterium]